MLIGEVFLKCCQSGLKPYNQHRNLSGPSHRGWNEPDTLHFADKRQSLQRLSEHEDKILRGKLYGLCRWRIMNGMKRRMSTLASTT